MASRLPPSAPPAPTAPGTTPTNSSGRQPAFRPSISTRPSLSGPPPPPLITPDKPVAELQTLPEAPTTPRVQNPGSSPMRPNTRINLESIPAEGSNPSDSGAPEIGTLQLTQLADTPDNVDQALDKFEAYRHLFDMAIMQFKHEKDLNAVNITLAKVQEFVDGPDFELLSNTNTALEHRQTARGFHQAYEKEVQVISKYLQEQCEVITQMLKMFIACPPDKLLGQKDALGKVIEEAHIIARFEASTIKLDFISQAERILNYLELQDGLLHQLSAATSAKDFEKLENLLARAQAAGFTAETSPIVQEGQKALSEYQKKHAKTSKTLKKGESLPPSSFYDLEIVLNNSSFFVGLNSVLPLAPTYKAIARNANSPILTGIDTSVKGIEDMPNLSYFLDQYIRLPLILYDCLQFIRYNFGWREEGIFRLSGNNDAIASALAKYDQQHHTCMKNGGYMASEQGFLRPIYAGPFTDIHPTLLVQLFTSPHDATNVMKRWLRQLNHPIVPFDQFKTWLDIATIPHEVESTSIPNFSSDLKTSQRLQKLQQLIHQLPPDNFGILIYLCLYIYCVSLNSDVSKMTADNLAIVVAPNILRQGEESAAICNPSGTPAFAPISPSPIPSFSLGAFSSMKPNNDMLNNSKTINEIFSLVVKYTPILFVKP